MTGQERLERRVRLLVCAYPIQWRLRRADEFVDTILDMLGTNASRIGARLALNIVLGGWRTRLREHPPLGLWLRYRLFNQRVPPQWGPWVGQDVSGGLFPLRAVTWGGLIFAVFITFGNLVFGEVLSRPKLAFILATGFVTSAVSGLRTIRMRTLRHQRIDHDGNPLPLEPVSPTKRSPTHIALVLIGWRDDERPVRGDPAPVRSDLPE